MKKLIVTIAIVLGLGMTTFAQEAFTGADGVTESGLFSLGTSFFSNDGDLSLFSELNEFDEEELAYINQQQDYSESGLFGMGNLFTRNGNGDSGLMLPGSHGSDSDTSADAPLGSGIAVLMGLGAAYMVGKRRKED